MTVVTFGYDCPACGAEGGPHRYDGDELACLSCGTPREVEPELVASVLDMRFCTWCRAHLPANHTCRPDEPPCESPAHLYPNRCGICPTDLALQVRGLARRDDLTRYGSPNDLDFPRETHDHAHPQA